MTEKKAGNKLLEKCIVHLPVEGITFNDNIDVSLATIGDDWIESQFRRKSLVLQVLLYEKTCTTVYPFLSRMQANFDIFMTSRC